MNCNCIKEVEQKILETLQSGNKDKGMVSTAYMQNMGISFDDIDTGWHTAQPIKYDFTPIKKDGTLGKTVNKEISMYHTFCPFCGIKIKKDLPCT